jgi:hypothetical protein
MRKTPQKTDQKLRSAQAKAKMLRALHAEWRKVSAGLASELPEREARLGWTNAHLRRARGPVESWSELTAGEAKYLLRQMREESGDAPAYRAALIATLAARLFGANWDEMLAARLRQRFQTVRAQDLSPSQARAEIEELISRIARAEGVPAGRIRAQCAGRAAKKSEDERRC